MILRFSARLKMSVRYLIARGPRCFRCRMFMLSGPVESLFDELDIASDTCFTVSSICVTVRAFVCLSIFLFELLVECLTVFTNCLLNAVAFCWGVMAGLLSKAMIVFCCVVGFLPPR